MGIYEAAPGQWKVEKEASSEQEPDPVEAPSHYTRGGVECIDAIRAAIGEERFRGYMRGTAIKYLWRCEHKHDTPTEDLRKARRCIDILLGLETDIDEECSMCGATFADAGDRWDMPSGQAYCTRCNDAWMLEASS